MTATMESYPPFKRSEQEHREPLAVSGVQEGSKDRQTEKRLCDLSGFAQDTGSDGARSQAKILTLNPEFLEFPMWLSG